MQALALECKFRDCKHEEEPGCAVRQALEDGRLPPERFESYRKLLREIAFLERSGNRMEQIAVQGPREEADREAQAGIQEMSAVRRG